MPSNLNEKQNETLLDDAEKNRTDVENSKIPTKSKSQNLFLYFAASVASLTSFTCGLLWVWTSPVIPKLVQTEDPDMNPIGRIITPAEMSSITGLLGIGSTISPLVAGPMADKLGRKNSLLISALPMLLSLIMVAFAKTVLLYCISRVLMGVGTGAVLTIVPMYLGEIAEDHNRGRITSLNGIFSSMGMVFCFGVGPFLSIQNFSLVSTIFLLIFLPIFFFWIPESPYFFALVDNQQGLRKSILNLRKEEREEEILKIVNNVQKKLRDKKTIKDLIRTVECRKALTITLGLVLLQVYCGVNSIFAYMQTIFAASGSKIPPEYCPLIVSIVQMFTLMLSSSIVDKFGRRILALISSLGCCLSLMVLGIYFFLKIHKIVDVNIIFWLPVSSLISFIIFLSLGIRPLPFIALAELFPSHVRASAATICSLVRSSSTFAVNAIFPFLIFYLGMAQIFLIFSIICLFGAIFTYWILPETKGKSFQEIQNILGEK